MLDLGMTANAAAVHEHESSSPRSEQIAGRSTPRQMSFFGFSFRFLTTTTTGQDSTTPSPQEPQSPAVQSHDSGTPSPVYSPRVSTDAEAAAAEITHTGIRHAHAHKHQPRPKTSFRFAHPPPSSRTKLLRIRPRLLLQLHKVSLTTRPTPTLDVVPSSLFGSQRVARKSGISKDCPGSSDLIVVPSENYAATTSGVDDNSISSDDGHTDQRKPVARLVCRSRKDDARTIGVVETYTAKETRWEVTSLPSGGYEFVTTDEHGVRQCVRWVVRTKLNRQNSSFATGAGGAADDGKRFTFSIIDPRTRRHPIIAWMSRTGIDILDQYSLSVGNRSAGSPPSTASSHVDQSTEDQTTVETDDQLRILIITTGIWIAFREGWSENPHAASDGPPTPTVHSPVQATSQTLVAGPSGTDNKRTEKGSSHRNSLQHVGNRLLPGNHALQRPASATAESWRSARPGDSRDRSADSAGQEPPITKHPPSKRRSLAERVGCMGRGQEESDERDDESDTRSMHIPPGGDGTGNDVRSHDTGSRHASASEPVYREADGHPPDANGSGHINDKKASAKAKKKKWRLLSGWFNGLGKKNKPR
ncbi:hypothetical protein VTO42DRAFT_2521 [Malbranchea cinnamomea]